MRLYLICEWGEVLSEWDSVCNRALLRFMGGIQRYAGSTVVGKRGLFQSPQNAGVIRKIDVTYRIELYSYDWHITSECPQSVTDDTNWFSHLLGRQALND